MQSSFTAPKPAAIADETSVAPVAAGDPEAPTPAPPVAISIRTKFGFAAILVFTMTISLGVGMTLVLQSARHEKDHRERLELMAASMRGGLLRAMLEGRLEGLRALMAAYGQHNFETGAEVLDTHRTVVASSQPTRIGLPRELGKTSAFDVPYFAEIETDGGPATLRVETLFNRGACRSCHADTQKVLGYMLISVNRQKLDAENTALLHTLVGSAMLTLILLLMAIWVTMSKLVTQPLHEMAMTMQEAQAGDLSVRVPERQPADEVTWLARNFNSMIERLAAARAKLETRYRQRMVRADRFATVGELASGLAHEIKNPLAGLSGALQILGDDFKDDPERSEVITEMSRQIERLDRAMQDLLRFARPQPPELQPVPLDPVVDRVVSLVRKYRTASIVQITCDIDSGATIEADAAQLEQVFLNMCLNALQAMPSGGNLHVATRDEGDAVSVSITDSGPGIPAEARAEIFKPFFTTKTTGTGLGLAISNRIIGEHQGQIEFDSPPEGGTTFTVRLPKQREAAAGKESA